MATLFAERQGALNDIATQTVQARKTLLNGLNQVQQQKAVLDAIPITLKTLIEEISADASKGGTYQAMQDLAVVLLNEAQTVSSLADQISKAIDPILNG